MGRGGRGGASKGAGVENHTCTMRGHEGHITEIGRIQYTHLPKKLELCGLLQEAVIEGGCQVLDNGQQAVAQVFTVFQYLQAFLDSGGQSTEIRVFHRPNTT